jgi:hypothetical protein
MYFIVISLTSAILQFVFQVCGAAVGLTGDICRALKNKVLPYCDEIMMLLLENLSVSVFSVVSCSTL